MRSSKERISELHNKAKRMARERGMRRLRAACAGMAAVCIALTVAVGYAVSKAVLRTPAEAIRQSLMASIFVRSGAAGYIFVAVLAFALGALFTIFCVHLKRLLSEKERENGRKL